METVHIVLIAIIILALVYFGGKKYMEKFRYEVLVTSCQDKIRDACKQYLTESSVPQYMQCIEIKSKELC
ncbi:MAG: hypothetical protein EBZ58_13780 [Bacteroidetes bacterium]|nr:hypothetical protein [Bacteroidota bacterium]